MRPIKPDALTGSHDTNRVINAPSPYQIQNVPPKKQSPRPITPPIMNTLLRFALFASAFSLIALAPASRATEPKWVPTASWPNSPEANEKQGHRAFTILREHNIQAVAVATAGVTLNVDETQATEARKLLAQAIVAENLQIDLIDAHGKIIAPAEILAPRTPK